MTVSAIVLAAGEGTRMRSPLPKVLHPVAGRPMILRVLDAVGGLSPVPAPVAVVVGRGAESVRAALADSPVAVRIAHQERQLGTGHAALQAERAVSGRAETVLLLYGDTPLLTAQTLARLLADHASRRSTLTLVSTRLADPSGYGRVLRDEEGAVARIVEDRLASAAERRVGEINAGLYAIADRWLWSALRKLRPSASGEVFLTDLVERALAEGEPVGAMAVEAPTEVLGVNTPAELAAADRAYLARLATSGSVATTEAVSSA